MGWQGMATDKSRHPSPVRLGLMPPLSGLVSLYGQEISWAGRIACAEVNEKGGILGRPLELILEDDGSLPETAVPAAERLIEQHQCVAIIGNLLSNSRIAVADHVAAPRKIPYLNFSFYEGSILNRYFFNFAALPNQQIDKMIPYMTNHFGPKMFFAGNNYEWPRGSIDAAKQSLLACGGEIVGEEYFPIGTTDFSQLVEQVAKSGADVFVPYAAGTDQINLLNLFSERGLKERMAVVMGHYDEAMVANLAPEVREGFYSDNTYFMSIDSEANHNYLQRLAKLPEVNGIWPNGNGVLTNFGEGTYLCVHAFARAANEAGTLESEALVQALEQISINGPQGRVVMDARTHHAAVNTYLTRCEYDGTFTLVKSFGRVMPVIPERYQHGELYVPGSGYGAVNEPIQTEPQLLCVIPYPLTGHTEQAMISLMATNNKHFDVNKNADLLQFIQRNNDVIAAFVEGGQAQEFELEANDRDMTLVLSPLYSGPQCTHLAINIKRKQDEYNVKPTMATPAIIQDNKYQCMTASDRILGVADIGIVAINEQGRIIQVNDSACTLFDYTKQELLGMDLNLLLPPHMRKEHQKQIEIFQRGNYFQKSMMDRADITGYRKDGTFFPAEASISKIKTEQGWVMVASIRDISTRKNVEEELVWQATHDPLSKLPNRMLLNDRMNNALQRSERSGKGVAVLFIDVDEFKLVNDTYGHDIGDHLLVEVANELTSLVRPGDTVARFGGDEFVVLCDQITDIESVTAIADRIIMRLKQPIEVAGQEFVSTVSIGVAIGFGIMHSAESLLQNADAAMYRAKEQGRDRWMVFSDEIRKKSRQQLQVATGLRNAIKNNELTIVLQPIIDARTEKIVGAETLLRWKHNRKNISPAVFIPIAEMTGTILPIGEWVFEQTCLVQVDCQKLFYGCKQPYISVNLSPRQLSTSNLMDSFTNIIKRTGADPHRIVLEITETTLMGDVENTISVLNGLGRLGLNLAIDDFGTGYSSLSHLKQLPVDSLKVDKVFVDEIENQQDSKSIASAIITMAHSLGLRVTAEGVETEAQLNILKKMKCDSIQGYYFYKPMLVDEFKELYLQQYRHTMRAS